PFGEGGLRALDPVERRIAELGENDLVPGGFELGPAGRADAGPPRTTYFERPLPFDCSSDIAVTEGGASDVGPFPRGPVCSWFGSPCPQPGRLPLSAAVCTIDTGRRNGGPGREARRLVRYAER